MFTGIVQETSAVVSVSVRERVRRVRIRKPPRWKLLKGQSIAVDGICSTVAALGEEWFDVEYMPETLSKTTAGSLARGHSVNLERSLRYGDPVDGHLVQGHVDARTRIIAVTAKGKSREMRIALPSALAKHFALHGSVALSGVSLTVARLRRGSFDVALIPHTLSHTNLGGLSPGDSLNIETDRTALLAVAAVRGKVIRNAEKKRRKKPRAS
ncbi:MAG: riboflavin synthase [Patescibacteria group bacterium]|nr:riboflavin synthase [bacterium]MDZ4227556.1 riboflavin synthase [Patescibacteria group bacterium]